VTDRGEEACDAPIFAGAICRGDFKFTLHRPQPNRRPLANQFQPAPSDHDPAGDVQGARTVRRVRSIAPMHGVERWVTDDVAYRRVLRPIRRLARGRE
jgi:hypothetical protein